MLADVCKAHRDPLLEGVIQVHSITILTHGWIHLASRNSLGRVGNRILHLMCQRKTNMEICLGL